MPLYEYRCEGCGEQFEAMQKFADEPLTTHEKCGGKAHRLLSVPALQFKGSGFYITDYAKGSSSANSKNGEAPKKAETAASSDSPAKTTPSAPAKSDS